MASLSETELEKLAAKIQHDLSGTEFACSSMFRILGGTANFIYYGIIITPVKLPDGDIVTQVIVKKAMDFAAVNRNFPLDLSRSVS